MMKTILGHLQNGVEKLESGALTPEDMELLVEDSKELYERLVILRYKIYESNVLGVKEPVVSASIRQTEIETPIDLFGSLTEPEFEVTYAAEDENSLEEEDVLEEDEEIQVIEEGIDEEGIPGEEQEHQVIDESIEEKGIPEEEEIEEEEIEEEKEVVVDDLQIEAEEEVEEEIEENIEESSSTTWAPEFSADQPIWMAEMEANIRDNRSVFPLDSLIGAFTLNEKLQFINELFDGSSDDFSANIKQLDQLASMDAARQMLVELSDTYNWDTESEIVEDFLFKICRRHAAGA